MDNNQSVSNSDDPKIVDKGNQSTENQVEYLDLDPPFALPGSDKKLKADTIYLSLRSETNPESEVPIESLQAFFKQLQKPGKYCLGEIIGQGGSGVVQAAIDKNCLRPVAMKTMHADKNKGKDYLRFIEEIQITAQLEHPNIVPVHEIGIHNNRIFYTMKMIKGKSLQEILQDIRRGKPETIKRFPLISLLSIFQRVCDAVSYAHSKHVLHRDLKPENIMIGDYGEVMLMDWGLAKILDNDGESKVVSRETLLNFSELSIDSIRKQNRDKSETINDGIFGTPQFIAPEMILERESSYKSDIYSMGCILYNILTLRYPVEGENLSEILRQVVEGDLVDPKNYLDGLDQVDHYVLGHCPNGKIPIALIAVTQKAIATQPEDRYDTVKDLQKDVTAYLGGFATKAEEANIYRRILLKINRQKRESILLMISLMLFVFLVIWFLYNLQSEKKASAKSISDAREQMLLLSRKFDKLNKKGKSFYAESQKQLEKQDYAEALKSINSALVIAPENVAFLKTKAQILESDLKFSKALAVYKKINAEVDCSKNIALCRKLAELKMSDYSNHISVFLKLHELMKEQGRLTESRALMQYILKLSNTNRSNLTLPDLPGPN